MLKLFYGSNTCALAAHIALNETGGAFDLVKVDTQKGEQRTPDYLAINPKSRVPALATDRGILTEVPALLSYIAQSFPEAALAPADSFDLHRMQSFNLYLASTIHITFAHLFRPERYADSDAAKADMKAKVAGNLATQLGLIEEQLSDGRDWVHGAAYTTSDPYLYVFARWLERDGAGGIGAFPRLAAHRARVQARPAVLKSLEQEGIAPV